jgi:H+/Cl- antiporter ClcA
VARLRILGLVLFAYGAIMLALLWSPWRQWALEHSIAEVVSTTDRRVGNRVDTVDEPIAVVGSAVLMFTGAWIGLLVPFVMNRSTRKQMIAAGFDPDAPDDPPADLDPEADARP